jgi:putative spermidine/putrescine transport system permease protein
LGEQDHAIPLDGVEKLKATHSELPVYIYPAGHGFNCDQRGWYHAESARLARDRALAFLRLARGRVLPNRPAAVPAGVISGALFAFVTSFDVVALFLTGPAERTLPRQMFIGMRENISPVIAAAASLVILLSVLLLTVLELLRRRNESLRGIRA